MTDGRTERRVDAVTQLTPAELCRGLLGEELRLPSVPTRWCGDADDLHYVLEHLDRMVIKRSFPHASGQPLFGRMLSTLQRAALVADIRANPDQFVGQEEMPLSTAPVWLGEKLDARPLVMRVYVAAGGLLGYAANPDELGRLSVDCIDRILRGADPGRLPIVQSSSFDLLVNLRTAKTLNLALPHALMLRATEVIS